MVSGCTVDASEGKDLLLSFKEILLAKNVTAILDLAVERYEMLCDEMTE